MSVKRYIPPKAHNRKPKSDLEAIRRLSDEDILKEATDPKIWDKHDPDVESLPSPKQAISIRLDTDVIDWFKADGPGYQSRINEALRQFIDGKAEPERVRKTEFRRVRDRKGRFS